MRLRLAFAASVFVSPLFLGHTQAEAALRSLCVSSTATGVVRTYYRALDQNRPAAAKACLTARYLNLLTRVLQVVDPDWQNVTSAHVVSIRARRVVDRLLPPDIKPAPYRAVQIGAEVVMHYRRIGGSPNGLNTWFIYVIKQRVGSPWRIAGIGGGP